MFLEHIDPISLPEMMFCLERSGATVETVSTNRLRKGAWLPMLVRYPLVWIAVRAKFLRPKHRRRHELHRRHIHWVLHPATLMGRIAIVVARKQPASA